MTLRFYKKETEEWYIDLPEYPGPKEDLQMVYGADTMLDMLSGHTDSVSITTQSVIGYNPEYTLRKMIIPSVFNIGGQWYSLFFRGNVYAVWLCDVTKHVFGDFPTKIKFKVL